MTRLERFREHKDAFFKEGDGSPLTPDQRERFTALDYFPERPDLRFQLVLDPAGVDGSTVEMETSDGLRKPFQPAGTIAIAIEGEAVTLIVYRQPERGRYFLPFRDATTGVETYELGRYLDPQAAPDGTLTVDFNYAYNPYCAYGEGWSCPIPPTENHLAVPLRAGEKDSQLPDR
jgi:uncharacterized protein (DUF1684 family)